MSGWEFIRDDGTFRLAAADRTRGLYFPLANEAGLMASITPDGGGDAKTDQHHFLMPPVSVVDLHNSRLKRTAWVCPDGAPPWSVTGSSHQQKSAGDESHEVEAGLLWHRSFRRAANGRFEGEMLTFSPVGPEQVEVSRILVRNTGPDDLPLSLVSVYPLFGRSADLLRDHRHVTSLLHRLQVVPKGLHLQPTMSFDERGHRLNSTVYSVLGRDSSGNPPSGCYPELDSFIGEGGDAERPQVIYDAEYRREQVRRSGHLGGGGEAIGALQFPPVTLAPGSEYSLYLISGVFSSPQEAEAAADRYCSGSGFDSALRENRAFWARKTAPVLCTLNDPRHEQWLRWVSLQPILRRIYGCSFLPYHDYGRGGRGWRDLWQDCLALLLMEPADVRTLLLSNFSGVRFDGTNATIVGTEPGSFLADRNSIPRVWMDHGAWPVLTVKLYVDQTGDLPLLTEEQQYFSDTLWARATERIPAPGETRLTTRGGEVCTGSVYEHMLLQQLSAFFNVGDHNCLRLEGADWNDGLDMADGTGESVAFTTLYGSNLLWLADAAEGLHQAGLPLVLAEELLLLLDRCSGADVDYEDPAAKRQVAAAFFAATRGGPSGDKTEIDVASLAADLREKGEHLLRRVREKEWIQSADGTGWFNGYYDNHGRRVEGESADGVRMTLTGQVFALMSGAATPEQVRGVIAAADAHLLDPTIGGYRLNTDFGEVKLDLGRLFGFAYGHKENGAMFSHMAVMYAYALYTRGEAVTAEKVMSMMYSAAEDFQRSRMYPGLPEYFDPQGRGVYCYLTGSASWYLLTVVTQMFGVRGRWGDLVLAPQLTAGQWGAGKTLSVRTCFGGSQLTVEYANPQGLDAGEYAIEEVLINGTVTDFEADGSAAILPAARIPAGDVVVQVQLGRARTGATYGT